MQLKGREGGHADHTHHLGWAQLPRNSWKEKQGEAKQRSSGIICRKPRPRYVPLGLNACTFSNFLQELR